jgi:hypothetical protein
MNRFALFGFLGFILIFSTWMANSMGIGTTTNVSDGIVTDGGANLGTVGSIFTTFFAMVAFQTEDIPAFVNIIYIVFALVFLYMLIDIIKDLIPFT